MKITDVQTYIVRQPEVSLIGDGTQDSVIIQIDTDAGISGIAEVDSAPYLVKAAIDMPDSHSAQRGMKNVLLGMDPMDTEVIWDQLYQSTYYYARGGAGMHAISGIDMALWDIKGKALGQPVHKLLGGAFQRRIPAYISILMPSTEDEVKRQETYPIRPAQGHELESFQTPVGVVVVYPCEQLNFLGAGPVIGAVIDDQHLLPLLIGQHVHEPNHHRHQAQQKCSPVVPGILQELVGGVLLESQFPVLDNAPGKVEPAKRQGKDGGEHRQGLCSPQFADAAAAQQGADLEIVQKGRNPVMQSFCLLLLLVVLSMVHLSLFFLISLGIFANPMYQKAKGFSR